VVSGQEHLDKFKDIRCQIRAAVKSMLDEAHLAVERKAPFSTYEDVFGMKDN